MSKEADLESSANAILQAAKIESIPATRRDDAIPQQADVVEDGLPVTDRVSVKVRFCIIGSVGSRMAPRNEVRAPLTVAVIPKRPPVGRREVPARDFRSLTRGRLARPLTWWHHGFKGSSAITP
jgi:hypothetical protein